MESSIIAYNSITEKPEVGIRQAAMSAMGEAISFGNSSETANGHVVSNDSGLKVLESVVALQSEVVRLAEKDRGQKLRPLRYPLI